ncbi:hypothetical protein EON66_09770 [archaeon]|nr:MAG: hypothetical protein EON66_09770 [archaeon]
MHVRRITFNEITDSFCLLAACLVAGGELLFNVSRSLYTDVSAFLASAVGQGLLSSAATKHVHMCARAVVGIAAVEASTGSLRDSWGNPTLTALPLAGDVFAVLDHLRSEAAAGSGLLQDRSVAALQVAPTNSLSAALSAAELDTTLQRMLLGMLAIQPSARLACRDALASDFARATPAKAGVVFTTKTVASAAHKISAKLAAMGSRPSEESDASAGAGCSNASAPSLTADWYHAGVPPLFTSDTLLRYTRAW